MATRGWLFVEERKKEATEENRIWVGGKQSKPSTIATIDIQFAFSIIAATHYYNPNIYAQAAGTLSYGCGPPLRLYP
jgi:hypothetical protein